MIIVFLKNTLDIHIKQFGRAEDGKYPYSYQNQFSLLKVLIPHMGQTNTIIIIFFQSDNFLSFGHMPKRPDESCGSIAYKSYILIV